jgi:hypothetical protein
MDINSEVVKHKKFGVGTIVESKDDYIIVLFHETKERKKFLYPEAFGEFLELQNKSSSDNQDEVMKGTGTDHEGEHEQRRIKYIKGVIKREKGIKKIIGFRQEEERNK